MGGRARAADKELARLIRQSKLLDSVSKRQWLRVVDHLTPADRSRLLEILQTERAAAHPPGASTGPSA